MAETRRRPVCQRPLQGLLEQALTHNEGTMGRTATPPEGRCHKVPFSVGAANRQRRSRYRIRSISRRIWSSDIGLRQ